MALEKLSQAVPSLMCDDLESKKGTLQKAHGEVHPITHELESRCADLRDRLAECETERSRIGGKLEDLQEDFDRMEVQLLSVLSGRTFRYSRGIRRLWSRIRGG